MTDRKREFHGMARTKPYHAWDNMKNRVKSDPHYVNIDILDRWRNSFVEFWSDMGPSYIEGMWLERIDNLKGYYPENCRWATMKEQQNNKRNNVLLTLNGETKTISQWAEHTGIPHATIRMRLVYGWTVEKALTVF